MSSQYLHDTNNLTVVLVTKEHAVVATSHEYSLQFDVLLCKNEALAMYMYISCTIGNLLLLLCMHNIIIINE